MHRFLMDLKYQFVIAFDIRVVYKIFQSIFLKLQSGRFFVSDVAAVVVS